MSQIAYNVTNMRSEGFFTYSRGAYTNFLHDERKMRMLFFSRRAYSTHFTRRVEKSGISHIVCVKLRFMHTIAYKIHLYTLKRCDDVLYSYYKKKYCSPRGRNLYDLVIAQYSVRKVQLYALVTETTILVVN